ncbi:hypothetical protein J6590_000692 [Homalodisca vitripennis]|nr:hypothetical protein J6590_000692 [Homalodisca vitripennis]
MDRPGLVDVGSGHENVGTPEWALSALSAHPSWPNVMACISQLICISDCRKRPTRAGRERNSCWVSCSATYTDCKTRQDTTSWPGDRPPAANITSRTRPDVRCLAPFATAAVRTLLSEKCVTLVTDGLFPAPSRHGYGGKLTSMSEYVTVDIVVALCAAATASWVKLGTDPACRTKIDGNHQTAIEPHRFTFPHGNATLQ